MITEIKEKAIISNNGKMREKILVDIPQSDMMFFRICAAKFGWSYNSRQNLWDEYIKSSPSNVDLSEEEIIEELRIARYGQVQANR